MNLKAIDILQMENVDDKSSLCSLISCLLRWEIIMFKVCIAKWTLFRPYLSKRRVNLDVD